MWIPALVLLVILTLILPVFQLVRIYRATGKWKYNLLRVLYGDLSGLIILGTVYAGYQHIGTASPSIIPTLGISIAVLVGVILDLYRAGHRKEEVKRAVFYSFVFLATVLQVLAAAINLTYYI